MNDMLFSGGRRSGRTTAMLNFLLEAVLEGQPKSLVVARDFHHALNLKRTFTDMLVQRKIPFEPGAVYSVNVDGSEVIFGSVELLTGRNSHVYNSYGKFWDHYAEEDQ